MSTLTIHPENLEQDTAIRLFLDALRVPYEDADKGMDETEYLLSSPANAEQLKESIAQLNRGEGVEVNLKTLFPK
jgi:hypothetical protein